MTDEMIKDYTLRISQSSRTDIIVILYELAIKYMEDAADAFKCGDHEKARKECTNAGRVFGDLEESLDFSYEIAFPLFRIYEFLSKEVSMAVIKNDAGLLVAPIKLMYSLKESFVKLAKEDSSGPVMGNSQTVYSGLTYGKGTLNDSMDPGRNNRGYMA